jgi:hypothetical protein
MRGLEISTAEVMSSTTSLAENMLKRKADKVTGEVMSRPGLGVTTVDSSGNLALCRPVNKHREALGEVTKGGTKRKTNGNSSGTKALGRCSKVELMLIVESEKIVLPEKARLVKADIVEAINKSRSSRPQPAVHVLDEDSDEEDTMVAVHVVDEDCDEEETMDVDLETNDIEFETNEVELKKKFLAVNTVLQLQAIVAKEKIVMGPGTKKKSDYVNAIYSARHVNNA